MSKTITLKLSQISCPPDLQIREALTTDHIADIAEAIQAKADIQPVQVVQDGNLYWCWDGHHRVAAYRTAGVNDVPVVVTEEGTRERARWLACGANAEHNALKRSNADKRRAVEAALKAEPRKSDNAIAEHCGVSPSTVGTVRKQLSNLDSSTREGRDGKTRDTSSIGRKPKPPEPVEAHDTPDSDPQAPLSATDAPQEPDPNSLEAVQAGIADLEKQCSALEREIRSKLGFVKSDATRPYCVRYSALAVIHPIQQVRRTLKNEMPVGGEPDEPTLYREQKAGK